jgi:hypothetical protein
MKGEYVVHGSLAMTRGSVLRVEDGCDLLIYVWEGSLWLTQERDRRDRYLGAGDWFRLDRDGVAIAQATRRSTVTLTAPAPELYARRIALAKAGTGISTELYSAAKGRRFWTGWFAPHARPTTASL